MVWTIQQVTWKQLGIKIWHISSVSLFLCHWYNFFPLLCITLSLSQFFTFFILIHFVSQLTFCNQFAPIGVPRSIALSFAPFMLRFLCFLVLHSRYLPTIICSLSLPFHRCSPPLSFHFLSPSLPPVSPSPSSPSLSLLLKELASAVCLKRATHAHSYTGCYGPRSTLITGSLCVCGGVCVSVCVCVPGCSTARICSFLCAARQPKLILPHAAYRHHYAEEFPAVSATAAHRECECGLVRGGEETCCKATLTDRGQTGFHIGSDMKTCSVCLQGNHSVYGIYCWPLCSLFVSVCKREHSVFMCVCGRVCVWLCSWCGRSGLAVCVSWCLRRWRRMSPLLRPHLLGPNHLQTADPIMPLEGLLLRRTRWDGSFCLVRHSLNQAS